MNVVIFGGTTEGRELSRQLSEWGAEVTVSVATAYGAEEQGTLPGVAVRIGPMSPEEMDALLAGADLCVDATHPYARHVSQSVRTACRRVGTAYHRLLRRASAADGTAAEVADAGAAAEFLAEREGNILLTTGAKELSAFAGLDPARLYPRILPTHGGLDACEALGIPHRNIIAMQGPFSREMNEAILRQYHIRWLVTKDGGAPGGFPEKLAAAKAAGATAVVLRRPEEEGDCYEEILALCRGKIDEKRQRS